MGQYISSILKRACVCIMLLAVGLSSVHAAPEVLGWLEGAYLQPWGVRVRAKLDSGALTSSMHAENIESYELDGEPWVRFHFPYGRKEGFTNGFMIERPLVRESKVKEHVGDSAVRYVIKLDICVSGDTFPVEFSLADRTKFNYPMILGRRAMSGRFLVDPGQSFSGKRSCPRRDKASGKLKRQKR